MSRDTDEDEFDLDEGSTLTGMIAPPYHRVIPRPARRHFYEVYRALDIDIIFVSDGIDFKNLRRVLGIVFETCDMHGGRQRAEERHFVGIPKVRIMFHEFELTNPFQSSKYPEPDYEDIGRARIMHVFRDRGEADEHIKQPVSSHDIRLPLLTV